MKQCFLIFSFLLFNFLLQAQSLAWERYYKTSIYSEGYFITPTPDNGYFIVGQNSGFGGSSSDHMYVLKTNAQGIREWEHSLGPGGSEGYSGCVTSDNHLLAAGEYRSTSGFNHYLVKIKLDGTIVWEKNYPMFSDQSFSVRETSDHHFILSGDNGVLKTDSSGNVIWYKYDADNCRDWFEAMDKNYVFTDYSTSDYGIIKTDTGGNIIWHYDVNDSKYKIYSIAETADSGILAAGLQTNSDSYFLLWLDANGNYIKDTLYEIGKAQALGFYSYGKPVTIRPTSDGNFVLCGSIEEPGSSANYCWLQKMDPIGNVIWRKTHLLNGWNFYYHVEETYDKGFIITGEGYTSGNNVVILKTDSLGVFCTNSFTITPNPICTGDTVILSSFSTDPDILWNVNGQIDSMNKAIIFISDSFSQNANITLSNASCPARQNSVLQVNQYNTAIESSKGNPFICEGDVMTLSASDAYSYLWSTGDTTASITVDTTGYYQVFVANACGLFDTGFYTQLVNNPIVIKTPDTSKCLGDTIQLFASGGDVYNWVGSNQIIEPNTSAPFVYNPASQNMYVFVTDTTTICTTLTKVHVDVASPLSITLTESGDLYGCIGNSAQLEGTPGMLDFHDYLWSTGATGNSISVDQSGLYYLAVNNACGVYHSDTIATNYAPFPIVAAAEDTIQACPGSVINLSVQGNASNYFWYDLNRTQFPVWSEIFSYTNGTSIGPGTAPKWTIDCSQCNLGSGDFFEVLAFRLQADDVDGEAIWYSEWISIANYSDVRVQIDMTETGTMESNDYVHSYYRVNEGPEQLFEINGQLSDDFSFATSMQEDINGDSLQIIVKIYNDSDFESHWLDNVLVDGYANPQTGTSIQVPSDSTMAMVVYASENGCTASDTIVIQKELNTCAPDLFTSHITPFSARLNWQPFDSCNYRFEIRGRNINVNNWLYLNINPGTANFRNVSGLMNNTTYVWQIKAFCNTDTSSYTNWSVLDTFSTHCQSPDSIWTNPITKFAARLNWDSTPGASKYELQGNQVGGTAVQSIVVNGNAVLKDVNSLKQGTSYSWRIRSICTPNGSIKSNFSTIDTFTTLTNKTPFLENRKFEIVENLPFVSPNPFSVYAVIHFNQPEEVSYNKLIIYSTTGQIVFDAEITGDSFMIHRGKLKAGLYFYQLSGNRIARGTFILLD